jgi:hypothetical protein
MELDQTQGNNIDENRQVGGLTILPATHEELPTSPLTAFDGLHPLLESQPDTARGGATPLDVPRWVWALPIANAKLMLGLWLSGAPFGPILFFGFIDIIMIGMLILVVYTATKVGRG